MNGLDPELEDPSTDDSPRPHPEPDGDEQNTGYPNRDETTDMPPGGDQGGGPVG